MTNAAYDLETIYAPDGKKHTASRLNALDLIRTAGYSWNPASATVVAAVEEAPVEAIEAAIEDTLTDERAVPPIDADTADIVDIAAALTGTDALSYLAGYSVDALKVVAERRYGEKLRANVSKEKAIERIMALEGARIAAESAAEAE